MLNLYQYGRSQTRSMPGSPDNISSAIPHRYSHNTQRCIHIARNIHVTQIKPRLDRGEKFPSKGHNYTFPHARALPALFHSTAVFRNDWSVRKLTDVVCVSPVMFRSEYLPVRKVTNSIDAMLPRNYFVCHPLPMLDRYTKVRTHGIKNACYTNKHKNTQKGEISC